MEFTTSLIKKGGWLLESIGNNYRTPEVCLIAVKEYGLALQYVDPDKQTYEMCLEAVRQNSYALEYVDIRFKTPELINIAVSKNGTTLRFVEQHLQTPEVCIAAIRDTYFALEYVQIDSKEVKLEAVKCSGDALGAIEDQTPEIVKTAIIHSGVAFQYITIKFEIETTPQKLEQFTECLISRDVIDEGEHYKKCSRDHIISLKSYKQLPNNKCHYCCGVLLDDIFANS